MRPGPAIGRGVIRGGGDQGAVAVGPGRWGDAERGVGDCHAQLVVIIHHLAVDGVSWRIVLEDLNLAWAQHRVGQPIALPVGGTSFARWSSLLAEHAHAAAVVAQAEVWRQVAATPAALPGVDPEVDTYASAGQLSVVLDDRDHPDAAR